MNSLFFPCSKVKRLHPSCFRNRACAGQAAKVFFLRGSVLNARDLERALLGETGGDRFFAARCR